MMIEQNEAAAEARHSEAMSLAAAAFADKEAKYAFNANGMREQCSLMQRNAQAQLGITEHEKRVLQQQISDLSLAATAAGLGPTGGAPGVSDDTQARLDVAIHTVANYVGG